MDSRGGKSTESIERKDNRRRRTTNVNKPVCTKKSLGLIPSSHPLVSSPRILVAILRLRRRPTCRIFAFAVAVFVLSLSILSLSECIISLFLSSLLPLSVCQDEDQYVEHSRLQWRCLFFHFISFSPFSSLSSLFSLITLLLFLSPFLLFSLLFAGQD